MRRVWCSLLVAGVIAGCGGDIHPQSLPQTVDETGQDLGDGESTEPAPPAPATSITTTLTVNGYRYEVNVVAPVLGVDIANAPPGQQWVYPFATGTITNVTPNKRAPLVTASIGVAVASGESGCISPDGCFGFSWDTTLQAETYGGRIMEVGETVSFKATLAGVGQPVTNYFGLALDAPLPTIEAWLVGLGPSDVPRTTVVGFHLDLTPALEWTNWFKKVSAE